MTKGFGKKQQDYQASFDALPLAEKAAVANRAFRLCFGIAPLLPYEEEDGHDALSAAMETHLRQIDGALPSHPHRKKTMTQRYEAVT